MDSQTTEDGQRYWHRTPAPALAGLVTGLHAYTEAGGAMHGLVEAASLTIPLVINFGSPLRIGLGRKPSCTDTQTSFAAGLFLGPVIMDSDGQAECVQVNFTPLGGRCFFGIPMSELADRMVPLSDLGDREIAGLTARLGELNSWEHRLDLVEAFVVERLKRSSTFDPAVGWAFERLAASSGRERISAISGRLEWSRRKTVERFRKDLGLPPKAVARIIRFNTARVIAQQTADPDWADIAVACGYSDQAHLAREFSALAGSPPTMWHAAA